MGFRLPLPFCRPVLHECVCVCLFRLIIAGQAAELRVSVKEAMAGIDVLV